VSSSRCDNSQSTCAVVRQITSAKAADISFGGHFARTDKSKNTPSAPRQVMDFLNPPNDTDAVPVEYAFIGEVANTE
jgi:hypothetical protein